MTPLHPPAVAVCTELVGNRRPRDVIDLNRYRRLHPDGKQLISSWLHRAWAERDKPACETFEPFIFAWISFNGWAACVTEFDRDRNYLDALLVSSVVTEDFRRLTATASGSHLSRHAEEFRALWPIFKAQKLHRKGIFGWQRVDRAALVNAYLAADVDDYQPKCWERHIRESGEVPLDWPHTLEALYRVRCNLFHGEKFAHSEMDQMIVSAAFRVLVHFLYESKYISAQF